MTPRITLITLGVSDVARARSFYERLGLKAASVSNREVVFFNVSGIVLAVWSDTSLARDIGVSPAPAGRFSGVALAWNVSSETEVDAALAHAVECGGTLSKPGQKTFWGGYAGYFADPDGHHWEVAHNPFWPLDAAGHVVLP
jgi:hypothetical protein